MENHSNQPGINASTPDEQTDVESAREPEVKEKPTEKDPNFVEWDGPDDPENPQNFSKLRKWIITVTMSSMTMWITFATSVFSTATLPPQRNSMYPTEVMVLGTSLVVFGFALGPFCWAPLSELYGRRLPLFSGYAIFAIFQIPVAVAQNLQTIMIFRFLIGLFGCSPLAVVGGAMADIWDPVDRAVAIAMFSSATFLGPVLGPIITYNRLPLFIAISRQLTSSPAGGFITDSYLGWRWTAWITLIASSLLRSHCPRSSSQRLTAQNSFKNEQLDYARETKNWALHSFLDEHKPTLSDIVAKYLLRPFQMLIHRTHPHLYHHLSCPRLRHPLPLLRSLPHLLQRSTRLEK